MKHPDMDAARGIGYAVLLSVLFWLLFAAALILAFRVAV